MDLDKIVFSEGLRALADKTQVHDRTGGTGVFRNRLTHSLEVSRVGRSLGVGVGAKMLNLLALTAPAMGDTFWRVNPEDIGNIVSAACLAHDVGNPPFGHDGEDAIGNFFSKTPVGIEACKRTGKTVARELCAHEGNAQGFRMITRSMGWRPGAGLNLTVATLAAFGKYPYSIRNEKKYGVHNADLETMAHVAKATGMRPDGKGGWIRHPLAWLMEAADDICYLTVDLEDAAHLGILSFDDIVDHFRDLLDTQTIDEARNISDRAIALKFLRSQVVKTLIIACVDVYPSIADKIEAGTLDKTNGGGLVGHSRHGKAMNKIRAFSAKNIYQSPAIQESRGTYAQKMGVALERLSSDLMVWLDTRSPSEVLLATDTKAGSLTKLAAAVVGVPVPSEAKEAFPWLLDQITLMSDADILSLAA
jgi:dGTPase